MDTQVVYQIDFLKFLLKRHSYVVAFVFFGTLLAYLMQLDIRYPIQMATYLLVLTCYQLSLFYIRHNKISVAKHIYMGSGTLFLLMVSITAEEFLVTINIALIAYFLFTAALVESRNWIFIWGIVYTLVNYLGLALRWLYPLAGFELRETIPIYVILVPILPLFIFTNLSHMIARLLQNLLHEKTQIVKENATLYQQAKRELAERIRTAEQLHLLSTAIEQSNTSVVITDSNGYITYINPTVTRSTGYTQAEALGQHTRILKSDITPPEQFDHLWQAITNGKAWQGELANTKKSGEIFWELASISPIKNDEGEITNFIALKEEITTRKAAEQVLTRNEQYLRSILKNSPVGICIVQKNGTIVFSNETIENLFGYTAEEFQALQIEDLVPEHQRDGHHIQQKKYFDNPYLRDTQYIMAQGLELHGVRQDGKIIPVQIILQHLKFEEQPSTIAFVHDISRQQEFEAQRLQFLLEKERINILAHFVRNAAHEFRTPLSIIQTNTYLMQQSDKAEQQEKYRISIEDQIDIMTNLLDNLITMTRLDNVQTYPVENYGINSLVNDFIVSSETWLQPKNLSLNINLAENLPNIGINTSDLVLALQQILTNAIQHSPPTDVIDIDTFATERHIGIKIQDHGAGIPAELIDRIFDRFYRIDETHDERGFGLGLSIAKKISELHHGKIEVTSEVGSGTSVVLYMPINSIDSGNSNQSEMYTP